MARRTTGRLFKRGNSKYYWLEYYVNGERFQQSLKVTTEKEAKRERDRILKPYETADKVAKAQAAVHKLRDAEEAAAAAAEEARERLAVSDAWQTYSDKRNVGDAKAITKTDYRQRWKKFAEWWTTYAPDRPSLEDVTTDDADAFARHLEGLSLSPNRYNKIMQTCRAVFTVLAPKCNDMRNPFGVTSKTGIKTKRLQTDGHRKLTEAELHTVLTKATGELRTLLLIGAYTGLRLKDACLLQWSSVDMAAGRLTVVPSKTADRTNRKPVIVPMHPTLADAFTEARTQSPPDAEDPSPYVLPDMADCYTRDRRNPTRRVKSHFAKCGLDTTTTAKESGTKLGRSKASFHSLRHSFVSMAAGAGMPLAALRELVGHGNPQIQQVYLDMGEDSSRDSVGRLPDLTKLPKDRQPAAVSAEDILARIRARLDAEKGDTVPKMELLKIMEA
jgi:integrase